MLSITYISTATVPFSEPDLLALLDESRTRNAARDISGLLLYQPHSFIQTIEGPDDAVLALLDRIRADGRHRGLHVVSRETLDSRLFPDWTMGFRRTSELPAPLARGFSDFLGDAELAETYLRSPERAHRLHALFREISDRG